MECSKTAWISAWTLPGWISPLDLCLSQLALQHLVANCGPCERHFHKVRYRLPLHSMQMCQQCTEHWETYCCGCEPLLRLLSLHANLSPYCSPCTVLQRPSPACPKYQNLRALQAKGKTPKLKQRLRKQLLQWTSAPMGSVAWVICQPDCSWVHFLVYNI